MATTNPWKKFKELLPAAARVIATVSSHNRNGTSTLALRSGGTLTAKGHAAPVGSKALVEGGEVVREVPDLSVHDAQV